MTLSLAAVEEVVEEEATAEGHIAEAAMWV
jgi:hypothetical protein